jgi:hypothetical protein
VSERCGDVTIDLIGKTCVCEEPAVHEGSHRDRNVYWDQDEPKEALRDIGRALALDPDDWEHLLGLLFVEYGMDRAQQIMRLLEEAASSA